MDISQYDIEIKRYTLIRAFDREIHPDLIENTINKGKADHYGKNGIRFVSKGSKRTIICVGQLVGARIVIFTIEEGD